MNANETPKCIDCGEPATCFLQKATMKQLQTCRIGDNEPIECWTEMADAGDIVGEYCEDCRPTE